MEATWVTLRSWPAKTIVGRPISLFFPRGEASMDEQTRSLFEAALTLPESQRMLLVERLLENLPVEFGGETLDDEAFAAELDRGAEEFQRDPSVGDSVVRCFARGVSRTDGPSNRPIPPAGTARIPGGSPVVCAEKSASGPAVSG